MLETWGRGGIEILPEVLIPVFFLNVYKQPKRNKQLKLATTKKGSEQGIKNSILAASLELW